MRILVACEWPESAIDELRSLGCDVAYSPQLTTDALVHAIRDTNILIVRRMRVTSDVLHAARSLQMILRAGNDVSGIAVEEASAQGVFVTHCPHRDSDAVAEMAFAMMLALDRRLVEHADAQRANPSRREEAPDSRGMAESTIGLVGYGPVEQAIAARATAFGMRVLAWSDAALPEATPAPGTRMVNWSHELAADSDVVFVYAPPEAGDDVRVDAELIGALREGAHLIFIGALAAIDETALLEAIDAKNLRVAIDAYPSDPARDSQRLRSALSEHANVLLTYRLADRTRQARRSFAAEAINIIRQFLVSGAVVNCVNLLERSPATWQLVLRLRDAVGVMAAIMDAIRADGVNAEEITSRVFVGARAAWCTIALDERPSGETLDSIRALNGVLHLELRAVV